LSRGETMNEKSKFKEWQEKNLEESKQKQGEEEQKAVERKAFVSRAEPIKIVGFDITIMEWVAILFKINVAVVFFAIPILLIIMIINS